MIYRIPKNYRDVFKKNPAFKYVKEFEKLDSRDMCFVMLYADPLSPIWGKADVEDMTDEQHRKLCMDMLGYSGSQLSTRRKTIMKGGMKMLEDAIGVYRLMMPFSRLELKAYKKALDNLQTLINSDFSGVKEGRDIAKLIQDGTLSKTREKVRNLTDDYLQVYDRMYEELRVEDLEGGSTTEEDDFYLT